MNGSHVNTISNRLSLRLPQRESLEILAMDGGDIRAELGLRMVVLGLKLL
jgi:hypothetical protein